MNKNDGKRLAQLYRELAASPAGVELLKWIDEQEAALTSQAKRHPDQQTRLSYLDQAVGMESVAQYIRGFLD